MFRYLYSLFHDWYHTFRWLSSFQPGITADEVLCIRRGLPVRGTRGIRPNVYRIMKEEYG